MKLSRIAKFNFNHLNYISDAKYKKYLNLIPTLTDEDKEFVMTSLNKQLSKASKKKQDNIRDFLSEESQRELEHSFWFTVGSLSPLILVIMHLTRENIFVSLACGAGLVSLTILASILEFRDTPKQHIEKIQGMQKVLNK